MDWFIKNIGFSSEKQINMNLMVYLPIFYEFIVIIPLIKCLIITFKVRVFSKFNFPSIDEILLTRSNAKIKAIKDLYYKSSEKLYFLAITFIKNIAHQDDRQVIYSLKNYTKSYVGYCCMANYIFQVLS